MTSADITLLAPDQLPGALDALAGILHACVQDGASVGFVQPFTTDDARAFWQAKVYPAAASGGTLLFAASFQGEIAGTVQLGLDLPPNQPHRADVGKLLVHPQARRGGLGRALMQVLEETARARGKRLLVLDTRSGDPSQRLYESLGFKVAGEIPDFCLNPDTGAPEPTTYLYKQLA